MSNMALRSRQQSPILRPQKTVCPRTQLCRRRPRTPAHPLSCLRNSRAYPSGSPSGRGNATHSHSNTWQIPVGPAEQEEPAQTGPPFQDPQPRSAPRQWLSYLAVAAAGMVGMVLAALRLHPAARVSQLRPPAIASVSGSWHERGLVGSKWASDHGAAEEVANHAQQVVQKPLLASVSTSSGRQPVPASSTASGPAFYQQTSNEILKLKLTLAVQRLMASHIALKILAVFVVAAPIVYLGGVLYSLITGAPIQLGLLKVYSVIIRVPGAKVTEEKSLAAFLLMNFFFLVGLFSFAVLIGIVSEEIKTQVKDVRGGNYSVITQGHTLVLNWNRQSMPLLRKIAEDSHGCTRTLGRELVILSEEPKDRMDVEIAKSRQIAKSGIKVVTREGAPHCVRDLESVSAGSARTVILLHPENAKDGDTKKAAAVLGLEVARNDLAAPPQQQQQQAKHGQQTQQQQVILQRIPGDPGQVRLFSLVNGTVSSGRDMALVEVNGNRSLARLIAQSAVQPGVANIYSSIAESLPGVPDFQLRTCGVELEGRSYQEARRSYKSAVVCGYVSHADGATHLNPRDGDVLHAADRLILLAHPGGVPARSAAAAAGGASATTDLTALQGQLQGATNSPSRPKKVVVLGWRGGIADLAAAIEEFASPGSEVVFVSRWSYPDLPANSRNCSFSYLEGSPFDHDACRRAGVGNCNSIIIGTLDCEGGDAKAADARSMASLLVVQDIVSAAAAVKAPDTPPHVVAAIHRIGTVRTAKHILKGLGPGCLTAELLTPNEIVSSQLLQVANEPGLAPALAELIDNSPGSQGIYLRKPECFNLDGARLVPFAEVVELARLRGETALGHVAGDGTLALSPGAAAAHLYGGRGSRVVVLASR